MTRKAYKLSKAYTIVSKRSNCAVYDQTHRNVIIYVENNVWNKAMISVKVFVRRSVKSNQYRYSNRLLSHTLKQLQK